MTDPQTASRLQADLFLLHAPSVYDFRERDDMLFAYLSDSDSVNVTSVYEMYPIGWFSIKQRLADHGLDAKIVNVASLMLMYPDLDVRRLLGRLEAPVFGFDLHWMTQCHGAIERGPAEGGAPRRAHRVWRNLGDLLCERADQVSQRGPCRAGLRHPRPGH